MKRGWPVLAGLLLLVSSMAGVWVRGQTSVGKYHAAGIAQASDIGFPVNAKTPGFVSLDVSVDANGGLQSIAVVRDLPPFTDAVVGAVKTWQFTPAMLDGQGLPGTVSVDVAFNPYNPSGVGLPGLSLQPAAATVPGNFQPVGLTKANYAKYPPNTVVSGSVVLQVHVGSGGEVHGVVAVRGKGILIGAATAAVKSWGFSPAMYKGKAVPADVVAAFVFAPPEAGTQ
jgi:outer membrane biosynthesis protein TonB